jgi:predicted metalloprotease with PDZ domain
MHPYLGDRGAWLSEGLATYYQNVLRGRSGLLTPTQAWARLREGFMDNDGKQYETTLERGSAGMGRTHDFQRVYWSGAAYWLTVDRDLRRDSAGKLNLELALSRFRDCCLPAHAGWRPEEFVARLDKLLGVTTFSQRYGAFAAMRQFPDWRKVYADLGIRAGDDGHLQFVADAPDAALRDAMLAHDVTP